MTHPALKVAILTFLFFGFNGSINAQDIEKVIEGTKADPLQITGSLGVQAGGSHAYGIKRTQRPPFYWSTRANLNLKFFDMIDAPLSFSYSPQGDNFDYPFNRQLPFNQLGISPRYKGLTVHLGYRSVQISPYSLAGASFNGAGIEWKPAKHPIEITMLYGQFSKAVKDTSLINLEGISLYNRSGYAGRFNYKGKSGAYGFHFFKAADDPNSALFPLTGLEATAPKENLVTGVFFEQAVLKKLYFKLELVRSAYTVNTEAPEVRSTGENHVFSIAPFLFTSKISTIYSGVVDVSLNYPNKIVDLQLAYKRIGSDYFNLGNPYFNNDLEVASVGLARRFMKNKLGINTNIGVQNNNLDNTQLDNTQRLALSGAINYAPVQRYNINFAYANFTTNTTKIRINELDSLAFYQISENMTLSNTLILGKDKKQQLAMVISNQQVRNQNAISSTLQNATISYTMQVEKLDVRPQIAFNYLRNEIKSIQEISQGMGYTVGLSKNFFNKKLTTRLYYNEMWYYVAATTTNTNKSIRWNASCTINKIHSFTLGAGWLNRTQQNRPKSGELQYNIGYTYTFSKKELFKRKNAVVEEEVTPTNETPAY